MLRPSPARTARASPAGTWLGPATRIHCDAGSAMTVPRLPVYLTEMADEKEMTFVATPEKGKVSALLIRPPGARHLLVLGHGASTNMRHATLRTIAERLSEAGVA